MGQILNSAPSRGVIAPKFCSGNGTIYHREGYYAPDSFLFMQVLFCHMQYNKKKSGRVDCNFEDAYFSGFKMDLLTLSFAPFGRSGRVTHATFV